MHLRRLTLSTQLAFIALTASFGCAADPTPANDCASLAVGYRNACPLAPGSEGEDVQEVVEICEELNALDDPTRCGPETRDLQRCIAADWGGLLGVLCGDTLLDTACVEEAEILEECLVENPCGAADRCDGECVDRLTDESHCGACGNACTSGQTCELGTCTCTADLENDPLNCGACGNACDPTSAVCREGMCTTPSIGSSCEDASDCGRLPGAVCAEIELGGYCTMPCPGGRCPSGSTCFPRLGAEGLCLADCTVDDDCRVPFVCVSDPESSDRRACGL